MNVGSESTLVLAPGELLATAMRVPGLPCPQPCGIDAVSRDRSRTYWARLEIPDQQQCLRERR
jgi:hypothetical protein